jgi:hypothetical protein
MSRTKALLIWSVVVFLSWTKMMLVAIICCSP